MKVSGFVLFIMVVPFLLTAQIEQKWAYVLQGQGAVEDVAQGIVVGPGANKIFVAGWTYQSVGSDKDTVFAVINLSSAGTERRRYLYNGSADYYNQALSICADSIFSYIYAAGFSSNAGTYVDFTVVKLDTLLEQDWILVYDGPASGPVAENTDIARSVTVDGSGVYAAGFTGQNDGLGVAFTVMKIRLDSPTIDWFYWNEYPWTLTDDLAQAVCVNGTSAAATGCIIQYNETQEDIYTVKLNKANGLPFWTKTFTNYSAIDWEKGEAVTIDPNGYVYMAGNTAGEFGEPQLMFAVIKYDANTGVYMWYWESSNYGIGKDIEFDPVTGHIYAVGADAGFCVLQFDTASITGIPTRTYKFSNTGRANSCVLDDSGNIYVAGYATGTGDDIVVVKLDSTLTEKWVYTYNGAGNGEDRGNSIALGDSNNVYVAGYTTGSTTGRDFIVIKLAPSLVPITEEQELEYDNSTQISIYPNPFRDKTSIALSAQTKGTNTLGTIPLAPCMKIYDIAGRVVKSFALSPSSATLYGGLAPSIVWDGTDDSRRPVPAGVYFVRLETGDNQKSQKVILLR